MPLPAFLGQLQHLPRNQRAALAGGAAVASAAGLYSYRKRRASSSTKPAAAASNPMATALGSAPDLSQYGQVAVLVPIDWQAGANFGGPNGLTGPLAPAATTVVPVNNQIDAKGNDTSFKGPGTLWVGDPSRLDRGMPFTPQEQALRALYHRENTQRGTSQLVTPASFKYSNGYVPAA